MLFLAQHQVQPMQRSVAFTRRVPVAASTVARRLHACPSTARHHAWLLRAAAEDGGHAGPRDWLADYDEAKVDSVRASPSFNVVYLRVLNGENIGTMLPVHIGEVEMTALIPELRKLPRGGRPLTYDLARSLLMATGSRVTRVRITEIVVRPACNTFPSVVSQCHAFNFSLPSCLLPCRPTPTTRGCTSCGWAPTRPTAQRRSMSTRGRPMPSTWRYAAAPPCTYTSASSATPRRRRRATRIWAPWQPAAAATTSSMLTWRGAYARRSPASMTRRLCAPCSATLRCVDAHTQSQLL